MKPQRTKASIKNDPQATPDELEILKYKDPRAALAHPNCPPELWWELAVKYPIEAQSSIVGKLFLLEDPARWATLEEKNRGAWVRKVAKALPLPTRYLFAAECAERVLPVFSALYPGEAAIAEAIRVCRLFARDEADETQRREAFLAAKQVARQVTQRARGYGFVNNESDQVVQRATWAASHAAQAAALALLSHKARGEETAWYEAQAAVSDPNTEQQWQWERLKQLLKDDTNAP